MTISHRRSLANQCNALKATGPRSAAGKRASSQNSRKHGLNSAPDFDSSSEYRALIELIAEEGFLPLPVPISPRVFLIIDV